MQTTAGVFLLLLAGSGVWAVRRYRSSDRLASEDRWVSALVPVFYVCLFAVYCGQILSMPFDDWNAARLAPVMALKYGYHLYYPPDEGPILGMLYGPLTAVAYLPALAAKTPTTAILIAGFLSVTFVVVPLGVLCFGRVAGGEGLGTRDQGPGRAECRRRPGAPSDARTPLRPNPWPLIPNPSPAGHVGFVFALAALLLHESTRYIATGIHADAPAVGFGLLACAVVMGARQAVGVRRAVLAGALATFAAFSKQFEVVLLVGLAVYLGVRFGSRPVVGFLLSAAVVGAVLTGFFGLLWGFEAMAQSTVLLPLRHPRREWLHVAGDFYNWLKHSAAVGLIVLFGLLVQLQRKRLDGHSAWAVLLRSPAGVLVFAALALVPASLASVARFGAEANSNHWTYFLIGAASLLLTRAAAARGLAGSALLWRASYLIAAGTVCLVLPELFHLRLIERLPTNPGRQAYAFARDHPQAAYFPWHPLSTLMADGKACHFEYGIFDRELVGARPTATHFREYLPSGLRYVVLRGDREQMITLTRRYLPEFTRRTTLPQLPGWTAFTRPPSTSDE